MSLIDPEGDIAGSLDRVASCHTSQKSSKLIAILSDRFGQ